MSTPVNIFQEKVSFYNTIIKSFGDPIMTKVKQLPRPSADKPGFSVYYAKVGCLLCLDDRYIACIVDKDVLPLGSNRRLSEISWISFQTRTIDNLPMKLKDQKIKGEHVDGLKDKIVLKQRLADRYVYYAEKSPVKIELLFDQNETTYSETGTIQSALDTYNCSISFLL